MTIKKPVDYSRVLLYLLFGCAMLFLRFVLDNGEPIALALVFALGRAGLSPYLSAFLFFCTAFIGFDFLGLVLYALQAVLVCVGFLIRARLKKSDAPAAELPAFLSLMLALGAFVAFAPFTPYPLPFDFSLPDIVQKVVIGALVFLLSATFPLA